MKNKFDPTVDPVAAATRNAVEELSRALEAGMYGMPKKLQVGVDLKKFLSKLGVKSARVRDTGLTYGAPLQMESLESILKEVTFDMNDLKLWPKK